jgi:hypothetical protein
MRNTKSQSAHLETVYIWVIFPFSLTNRQRDKQTIRLFPLRYRSHFISDWRLYKVIHTKELRMKYVQLQHDKFMTWRMQNVNSTHWREIVTLVRQDVAFIIPSRFVLRKETNLPFFVSCYFLSLSKLNNIQLTIKLLKAYISAGRRWRNIHSEY